MNNSSESQVSTHLISTVNKKKKVQVRGGHCVQILGYMPMSAWLEELATPNGKKCMFLPCHSYHE